VHIEFNRKSKELARRIFDADSGNKLGRCEAGIECSGLPSAKMAQVKAFGYRRPSSSFLGGRKLLEINDFSSIIGVFTQRKELNNGKTKGCHQKSSRRK
jgi:hypothetical protein